MTDFKYMLFIALSVFVSGCTLFSSKYMVVQMDEHFNEKSTDLRDKKIYYFEPEIRAYHIREELNKEYFKAIDQVENTREMLYNSAASNNIDIGFLKEMRAEFAGLYVSDFLRLRNEIKKSFSLQDHDLNKTGAGYSSKFRRGIFLYPPRLTPVSDLVSEKLDTKYIGYFGIFAVNSRPQSRETKHYVLKNREFSRGKYFYLYHVVVDIEKGEVIYREAKKAPVTLNSKNLDPIIYDSYFVMNKNLKK